MSTSIEADPARTGDAHALQAVRQSFGLDRHVPVDYEAPRLGLFDPAERRQRASAELQSLVRLSLVLVLSEAVALLGTYS